MAWLLVFPVTHAGIMTIHLKTRVTFIPYRKIRSGSDSLTKMPLKNSIINNWAKKYQPSWFFVENTGLILVSSKNQNAVGLGLGDICATFGILGRV